MGSFFFTMFLSKMVSPLIEPVWVRTYSSAKAIDCRIVSVWPASLQARAGAAWLPDWCRFAPSPDRHTRRYRQSCQSVANLLHEAAGGRDLERLVNSLLNQRNPRVAKQFLHEIPGTEPVGAK